MEAVNTRNRWGVVQWLAAVGAFVGVIFLALSLKHLAEGLSERTGEGFWWCLAQGLTIDASIVVSEAALMVSAAKGIRRVKWWAMVWLLTALATSSVLNAQVYTHAQVLWSWGWFWNAFLGIFSPLGVFFMAKIATQTVLGDQDTQDFTSLDEARTAERLAKRARRKRERVKA